MPYDLVWTEVAAEAFDELRRDAEHAGSGRRPQRRKSSRQEGLFKQVEKALGFLQANPRHLGLQTHEYSGLENPYHSSAKVFEAYAQQNTPGAYRVFWCYGPEQGQITILAITPHP